MSFFFGTAVSSCFFFQLESHFEWRPSEFGFIGLFLFSLKKSFFYFKIFRNKRNEIVNVPRRQSCVISRFIFYIFYIFFWPLKFRKRPVSATLLKIKKKKNYSSHRQGYSNHLRTRVRLELCWFISNHNYHIEEIKKKGKGFFLFFK